MAALVAAVVASSMVALMLVPILVLESTKQLAVASYCVAAPAELPAHKVSFSCWYTTFLCPFSQIQILILKPS